MDHSRSNQIQYIPAADFNLQATLESGQVFGFEKGLDGSYEFAVDRRRVTAVQLNGTLSIFARGGRIDSKAVARRALQRAKKLGYRGA